MTERKRYAAGIVGFTAALAAFTLLATTPYGQTPAPNKEALVHQVAGQYSGLLQTNTYESCLEFTQRFLEATHDPNWGHVGKTAGESQSTPPGFQPKNVCSDGTVIIGFGPPCPAGATGPYTITGVSHDAVKWRPTGEVFDLLSNASANSDPNPAIHGPAKEQWSAIPPANWRPSNPWVQAVPVEGSTPAPPVCPVCPGVARPPYPGDASGTAIGDALFADYAEAKQDPNPGMGVWFWRTAWDAAVNGITTDASIKKHRNEWRAILGLPPLP